MAIHPNYKPPETGSGELKTYVEFFGKGSSGPEPGGGDLDSLYDCTAEVYNPSMKDIEVMKVNGTKKGITLKIRDPLTDYIPSNKHHVKIYDFRYKDITWDITDVRPDIQNSQFIVILLGASS